LRDRQPATITTTGRRKESVMRDLFARFVREDSGQDLIEYGLLAGIITALSVVAIQAIGPKVQDYITDLDAMLPAVD
jgi:Flp pilus assembly pilin Flp